MLIPKNKRILSYYEKPFESLSKRERWLIGVHGLRGTPLHRRDWGVRQIERTVNRQLVPIRTYYLRASENPDFRLDEVVLKFMLQKHGANGFDDRILDISFAAEYIPAVAGRPPLADRAYTLRLSAADSLPSAFFYRSDLAKVDLLDLSSLKLSPEKEYTAKIKFSDSEIVFLLDDQLIGRHSGERLDYGMLALTAGWVPVKIRELNITAHSATDSSSAEYSGLVPQFHRGHK